VFVSCSRCSQWDSSATLYLHSLLQGESTQVPEPPPAIFTKVPPPPASTLTEAVLLETLPGSTGVELYVTVGGVKVSRQVF